MLAPAACSCQILSFHFKSVLKLLDFELKRFSSFAIAQVSILEINQLK